MEARGACSFAREAAPPTGGTYVAPAIVELDSARDLKEEVFGPVLHVVRWRAGELDQLLDDIAAQWHRAHARHPFAHRRDVAAHRRRACRTAMST